MVTTRKSEAKAEAESELHLSKSRLEALTDGIFAVAMTLLVLELKIPESVKQISQAQLIDRLWGLEDRLISYFVSFLVLGLFWIGHQTQLHFVRHVDRRMLLINLLLLCGVSFVPFTTALLGEYRDMQISVILYSIHMALIGTLYYWNLEHFRRRPHLATEFLTPQAVQAIRVRVIAVMVLPLASVAISFYSPRLAVLTYTLLLGVGLVTGRNRIAGVPTGAKD